MSKRLQISIALFPLLLTPVFGYFIAEGWLNLGSGDKDLLLLLPWLLWSLLFAISSVVLILRGLAPMRWLVRALAVSVGICFGLWLVLLGLSLGGVV